MLCCFSLFHYISAQFRLFCLFGTRFYRHIRQPLVLGASKLRCALQLLSRVWAQDSSFLLILNVARGVAR